MRADLYFDVISPFVYLQLEQLDLLPDDMHVDFRPVLFAGLLNHWGQLGPAEIPSKRLFTYRFAKWRAASLGIPFQLPPAHPFNPLKLLRLAVLAGNNYERMREIARFVWRDGYTAEDASAFSELAARVGVDNASERIAEPAIKQAVRENTENAISAGVFGVPTFVFEGEVFWGADALSMLADRILNPEKFSRDFENVDAMPVGARRQR